MEDKIFFKIKTKEEIEKEEEKIKDLSEYFLTGNEKKDLQRLKRIDINDWNKVLKNKGIRL